MRQKTTADTGTTGSLHICPRCRSGLVQPTRWEQASNRVTWRVWRRCPECEWTGNSVHGAVEIDAFDAQLDLGALKLADELGELELANMSAMVETFLVALRDDLIGPDDFS